MSSQEQPILDENLNNSEKVRETVSTAVLMAGAKVVRAELNVRDPFQLDTLLSVGKAVADLQSGVAVEDIDLTGVDREVNSIEAKLKSSQTAVNASVELDARIPKDEEGYTNDQCIVLGAAQLAAAFQQFGSEATQASPVQGIGLTLIGMAGHEGKSGQYDQKALLNILKSASSIRSDAEALKQYTDQVFPGLEAGQSNDPALLDGLAFYGALQEQVIGNSNPNISLTNALHARDSTLTQIQQYKKVPKVLKIDSPLAAGGRHPHERQNAAAEIKAMSGMSFKDPIDGSEYTFPSTDLIPEPFVEDLIRERLARSNGTLLIDTKLIPGYKTAETIEVVIENRTEPLRREFPQLEDTQALDIPLPVFHEKDSTQLRVDNHKWWGKKNGRLAQSTDLPDGRRATFDEIANMVYRNEGLREELMTADMLRARVNQLQAALESTSDIKTQQELRSRIDLIDRLRYPGQYNFQ
jgi:hypothetical protein